jgi:hypothetical protein
MLDQVYAITPQRKWASLRYMFFVHAATIGAYGYFFGFRGNALLVGIYLVFFLFDALPTIVLYFQYLAVNRNTQLVIKHQSPSLTWSENGVKRDYSFDEIARVIYVAGYGGGAWYSFSEYRYFVLVFKDGEKALITSLMIDFDKSGLEMLFKRQVTTRIGFFPWVRRREDFAAKEMARVDAD